MKILISSAEALSNWLYFNVGSTDLDCKKQNTSTKLWGTIVGMRYLPETI